MRGHISERLMYLVGAMGSTLQGSSFSVPCSMVQKLIEKRKTHLLYVC